MHWNVGVVCSRSGPCGGSWSLALAVTWSGTSTVGVSGLTATSCVVLPSPWDLSGISAFEVGRSVLGGADPSSATDVASQA